LSRIERRPIIHRWAAVHPVFPMLMIPILHPWLGWLWMVFNARLIAGPSRTPEIVAVVTAGGGATALAAVHLAMPELSEGASAWLDLSVSTWLLGGSLIAYAFQKRRWDLMLPVEQRAGLAGDEDATLANPPADPAEHATFARQLVERGWLLDAEEHARATLRDDPNQVEAHIVLSESLLVQGRYRLAAARTRNALKVVNDETLWMLLASALSAAGDHDAAAKELIQARICYPDDTTLELLQAETWAAQGELQRAEQATRRLTTQDPYDADAQALLADVLLRMGQLDAVRLPARNALRHDPEHPVAMHAMGGARAQRVFLLGDWWRHNDWLARHGQSWGIAPYVLAFVLFELGPVIDHPGPRRVGVLLAIGYALFTVWGMFAYRTQLEREFEDAGLE